MTLNDDKNACYSFYINNNQSHIKFLLPSRRTRIVRKKCLRATFVMNSEQDIEISTNTLKK